jgi:hypothetical protein
MYLGDGYFDTSYPYGNGPWYHFTTYTGGGSGTKTTFEKRCWDELHPGPPYKTGGPLDIYEFSTNEYESIGPFQDISWKYKADTSFLPAIKPSSYLAWANLDEFISSGVGDAFAHGATGWDIFSPTRPGADLGIFLGEFKDVPRMLKGTAKAFHDAWRAMGGSLTGFAPKSVANHWLNTQFGWMPFLNDLRKFQRTTKLLDTKLKRLRRNNGKWERRGGTFISDSETEIVDQGNTNGLYPALIFYHYETPSGSKLVTSTTTQQVWFEAAFRYWIPGKPDSWYWKARAMAMLYGLTPSPSLIWELTPWSWLIDWWSNAGDCISNISSTLFDNLAAKYAFVMAKTSYKVTYEGSANLNSRHVHGSWDAEYSRKSRAAASPFGFGLTGDDFSTRQWSILSALGLTRLGR